MRFLALCKQVALAMIAAASLAAQVYSPKLLREGQPDPADLKSFAGTIVQNAHAATPRQKAEAIWRFFLTDGRFVHPGFFYHIAGWAYEEPAGEVLDPVKLLNSYGFGLCYHIAPLLEAVYEAAGFANARVWFLTGHTVTEVFYEGRYHYFDSDMMGYNVLGDGNFRGKPVASVHEIEGNGAIILGKLLPSGAVKPGAVDNPWYPADVRAHAIGELAALFTTTSDNSLYPFRRYASGHSMSFTLRKGESITRFFAPEEPGLAYLPYQFDGKTWTEFPQESREFNIRTSDGPRSQKDNRTWGTGRIDYDPPAPGSAPDTIIAMPCPYVIIDAAFNVNARIDSEQGAISIQTSVDEGAHWIEAGRLSGPHHGSWEVEPGVLAKTKNGRLTAVSGSYRYQVRIKSRSAYIASVHLVTRFQLNPRSLPAIEPGDNRFHFSTSTPLERIEVPAAALTPATRFLRISNDHAQILAYPEPGHEAAAIYKLEHNDEEISAFDVGIRFLDMRDGRAPDKLTAEVRQTDVKTRPGLAALSWSTSPDGPYREIWSYNETPHWFDGEPVDRLLRWPEVFKEVTALPSGTRGVYVKVSTGGPAFDTLRLAGSYKRPEASGQIVITQKWQEGAIAREHVQTLEATASSSSFFLHAGTSVRNDSITFACR